MAKSIKKTDTAAPAAKSASSKSPAPAAAGKPPAKKSGVTTAPATPPSIDTSVAASTAAAMIGNKTAAATGSAAQPAKKESAAFKQLKAGLNKPAAGALGGAFGGPMKQKKSNQNFGGGKQIGHNQTFGSDATRSGVPRRTSG